MLKRITAVLLLLLTIYTPAFATTLEEAVDRVARRLFVETIVDKNVLRLYGDWGFVDTRYRAAIAGSLHAGLLCPDGNLLHPKSADLSPLINGLIRFGISNSTFNVAGFQGETDITPNSETLYIIDNEIFTDYQLDPSKYYYAVVNRDKRAYVIWQATDEKVLWLFSGKLFLQENGNLIITLAKKKSFGVWSDISKDKYTTVRLGNTVPIIHNNNAVNPQDINITLLDTEVYILGNYYDGEIKASYIEIK